MRVSKAEVVRHFLKIEATKQPHDKKDKMLAWCAQPDTELLRAFRAFADECPGLNPFFVWTVGTNKSDQSDRVAYWTKEEHIKCKHLFSGGISEPMLEDLEAVGGNLLRFSSRFWDLYRQELKLVS